MKTLFKLLMLPITLPVLPFLLIYEVVRDRNKKVVKEIKKQTKLMQQQNMGMKKLLN